MVPFSVKLNSYPNPHTPYTHTVFAYTVHLLSTPCFQVLCRDIPKCGHNPKYANCLLIQSETWLQLGTTK